MSVRYKSRFYTRSPDVLARALIGKRLVHGTRSGVIVETEAYFGPEDLASHARFGETPRNHTMFGRGGLTYVYLCYGIHRMFNIVAGRDREPGAVLIRALAPGRGVEQHPSVARGPGKLTRALGIGLEHNGLDLTIDSEIYLTRGVSMSAERIAVGPRIGIDYAGSWTLTPLRFYIIDHPCVSRTRTPRRM